MGPHHSDDILRGAEIVPLEKAPERGHHNELPKAMEQIGWWVKDRVPLRHKGRKARFWRKANVPGTETTNEKEL